MDPEVISEVETLARTLSHHRFRDGPLEIDPNDFDAAAILSTFVRVSEEQGIHLRKSGVVAEDISGKGVDSIDFRKGRLSEISSCYQKPYSVGFRLPDRKNLEKSSKM